MGSELEDNSYTSCPNALVPFPLLIFLATNIVFICIAVETLAVDFRFLLLVTRTLAVGFVATFPWGASNAFSTSHRAVPYSWKLAEARIIHILNNVGLHTDAYWKSAEGNCRLMTYWNSVNCVRLSDVFCATELLGVWDAKWSVTQTVCLGFDLTKVSDCSIVYVRSYPEL